MPRAREGVSMPKQRYESREPAYEWSQIRPLLKDPTQIHYEILRPIVLFGVSPQERSVETGDLVQRQSWILCVDIKGRDRYAGQAHRFSRATCGEQRASRHPQSSSITHSSHWS